MAEHTVIPLSSPPASDPWASLRAFTAARIALGRTGTALPLRESLRFSLAHAHARDAVYASLDVNRLAQQISSLGLLTQELHSQAANRLEYLQRPDKGRKLNDDAVRQLQNISGMPVTLALVLADGLSATALNSHASPLLQLLLPALLKAGFQLAPVSLVQQGRVAVGDEIGALLHACMVLVLIGERPGLSAADSLGAYLTYAPAPGLTDEARNCVSNIRPEGLNYAAAAEKILYLVHESFRLKLSGVLLKDYSNSIAEKSTGRGS